MRICQVVWKGCHSGHVKGEHEDWQCHQPVYVIQDLEENLLGLPAIRELNVLYVLQEVTSPHEDIISSYPKNPLRLLSTKHWDALPLPLRDLRLRLSLMRFSYSFLQYDPCSVRMSASAQFSIAGFYHFCPNYPETPVWKVHVRPCI